MSRMMLVCPVSTSQRFSFAWTPQTKKLIRAKTLMRFVSLLLFEFHRMWVWKEEAKDLRINQCFSMKWFFVDFLICPLKDSRLKLQNDWAIYKILHDLSSLSIKLTLKFFWQSGSLMHLTSQVLVSEFVILTKRFAEVDAFEFSQKQFKSSHVALPFIFHLWTRNYTQIIGCRLQC